MKHSFTTADLASTYYIILSQYKIVDVSNQMLLELKKIKNKSLNAPYRL